MKATYISVGTIARLFLGEMVGAFVPENRERFKSPCYRAGDFLFDDSKSGMMPRKTMTPIAPAANRGMATNVARPKVL